MKKLLNTFLILSLSFSNLIFPSVTFASNERLLLNEKRLSLVQDIKEGRKVDISQTISNSEKRQDRFVVFVKKNKINQTRKSVISQGGVLSMEDDAKYGKAMALPLDLSYMEEGKKSEFITKINSDTNVLAISPIQKRTLSSIPSFDDPLYPTDLTYDSTKQWYLSQPNAGKYGIDILRAWQHLDTAGKPYNGNPNLIVAVIDTGAAFEDYSKYDKYGIGTFMINPVPWIFSKASDFTDNLYENTAETPENQIDDDQNSVDICIDKNENGMCDNGEAPASFFDDLNGVNIVDWGKYWSRVDPSEYFSAPICSNLPGVKCVVVTNGTSACDAETNPHNSANNYLYQGCWESDMGHPNDVMGHGTFVSNIISAKGDNNISGVGVASGVKLLSIKIFGESYNQGHSQWVYESAYTDQIVAAVNYAVDAGAKIINMSFAGDSIDLYEKMAMDSAYYDHDVLLVASSGNDNTSAPYYPAGYDSVLSVGASTKTGSRTTYSNYGSTLDMVAPVDTGIKSQGMNSWSSAAYCTWDSLSKCLNVDPMANPSPFATFSDITAAGTSFATPQVVGVAALIKTMYPNLTASDLRHVLTMSTSPSGSLNYSTSTGNGVLNAYNAVNAYDYREQSINTIKRIFQSQVSTSGYVQTRYSDTYGSSWSNWITSGNVKSAGNIKTLSVPNNSSVVVQIMKGTNSGVYTRYAANFGYLSQDDSQWSNWTLHGATTGNIVSAVSGNNIVFSWKGTDGKIYTRYSDNGTIWNLSATSGKTILGNVSLVDDPTHSKLLQTIRSVGYYLYTRTSSDNGATWSAWKQSYDSALSDPSVAFYNDRIFRSVRVSGNYIVSRVSSDGGNTWTNRNRTYGKNGLTASTITLIPVNEQDLLFQTYRGTDNKIYTRFTINNGASWSTQSLELGFKSGIYSVINPVTLKANSNMIQMTKTNDGYLMYRKSINGGANWGAWRNTGSIKTNGGISLAYDVNIDRVYVSALNTSNILYTRMSDDKGTTYTPWVSSVSSQSGISNAIILKKTLDLSN